MWKCGIQFGPSETVAFGFGTRFIGMFLGVRMDPIKTLATQENEFYDGAVNS